MYHSSQKITALPKHTEIYCGHEYTQSNARFALTVDPDNSLLRARVEKINALRAAGQPTVPTTIALELATNPFMRAEQASVAAAVGMPGADAEEVFSELRGRKDRF